MPLSPKDTLGFVVGLTLAAQNASAQTLFEWAAPIDGVWSDAMLVIETEGPMRSNGTVRVENGGTIALDSGLDGGTLDAVGGASVSSREPVSNTTLTGVLGVGGLTGLLVGPGPSAAGSIG